MSQSLPSVVVLIVGLALVSSIYTYFRAGVLASPDQVSSKGLAAARRNTAVFYAFVAILVGVVSFFVFRGMVNASPESATSQFLLLAIGIGVVLELLGAVIFKLRGLADLTVLHILHITAYGWLLPQVFPV
jgi:hypothetical protein